MSELSNKEETLNTLKQEDQENQQQNEKQPKLIYKKKEKKEVQEGQANGEEQLKKEEQDNQEKQNKDNKQTRNNNQLRYRPKTQQPETKVYRPKSKVTQENGTNHEDNIEVEKVEEENLEPKRQYYRRKDPNNQTDKKDEAHQEVQEGKTQPRQQQQYRQKNGGNQQPKYKTKGRNDEEQEHYQDDHKEKKQGASRRDENQNKTQEEKKFQSAYQEYLYGDWKYKRDKIFVTLETQVPPMPKNILEQPDETSYHKEQVEIEEKIESLNEQIRDLSEKMNEKAAQLREDLSGRGTMSKEMKALYDELGEIIREKKQVYEEIDRINTQISDMEARRNKALKKIHAKYNKVDLIKKGVNEIERLLTTTTQSNQKEKELRREQILIKESQPYIEEYDELKELIQERYQEKKEASVNLPDLKSRQKKLIEEIEKRKKGLGNIQQSKESIQKTFDKINVDRNTMRKDIQNLRIKKEEQKEKFYKQYIAYEMQQMEIKTIEWIAKTKEMVLDREEQKRLWEEERQQKIDERKKKIEDQERREENRRKREDEQRKEHEDKQTQWEEMMLQKLDIHPYLVEIDICDHLLRYCKKHAKRPEDEDQDINKVINNVDKLEIEEKRKKAIQEAIQKGKLVQGKTREEREQEENMFRDAQASKKKKQRKEGGSSMYEQDLDALNLDIGMIKRFARLKVTAPLNKSELEKTIKELEELQQAFEEKGEIEKEEKKRNFLREQGRFNHKEEEKGDTTYYAKKNTEAYKRIEQIGNEKHKWVNDEEGIDVDTYEINYVPGLDDQEGEDEDGYSNNRGRGGRGRQNGRGGRGSYQRGGRGGRQGYQNRDEQYEGRGGYRGGYREGQGENNYYQKDRVNEEFDYVKEKGGQEFEKQGAWEDHDKRQHQGKRFQEVLTKTEEWPEI